MLTVNGDEGTDDQPLDFSQKSHSVTEDDLKKSHSFAWKKEVEKHIFTTPSPSPPESQSQVLCQILSGSIFGNGTKVNTEVPHVDHNLAGSGGNDCNSNGSSSSSIVNDRVVKASDIGSNKCKSAANSISDSPMSPLATLLDTTSPLIASQALASALVSSANPANFMATTNNLLTTAPAFFDPKKKYTRPFKAYPTTRDMGLSSLSSIYNMPLQMSLDPTLTSHNLLASTSDCEYLQYRAQVMNQKRVASDGRRKSSPGSGAAISPTTCQTLDRGGGGGKRKSSTCSNSNRSTSANLSDDSNQHSSCGEVESGSTNSTSSSVVGGSATQAKLNGTQGQSEETNGSNAQAAQATTTTPASGRKRGRPLPDDQKDEAYWERRRKNNEAAKRSRDARRAKEDEIAIRAAFLEQESIKLRLRIATVENENSALKKELDQLRRVMSLNN